MRSYLTVINKKPCHSFTKYENTNEFPKGRRKKKNKVTDQLDIIPEIFIKC